MIEQVRSEYLEVPMPPTKRQIKRRANGPDGYEIIQNQSGHIEIRHGTQKIADGEVLTHLKRINLLAKLRLPMDAKRVSRHTIRSLGSTIISALNARATV